MGDFSIDNFGAIVASVLTLLGFYVTYRIYYKTRFNRAASAFRSTVLAELQGIYPVTQYWDMNIFPKFAASVFKIESAAEEFKFVLRCKTEFESAVKEYRDYCKTITWNQEAAWTLYPTSRKPGDVSPRDKFSHIVDRLLSFTVDKRTS